MTRETSSAWDYSDVPERRWEWRVEFDPSLHCPTDKWVVVSSTGLVYAGDCEHPNWGGGYGIGSQTHAQFLRDGPLAEQLPEEFVTQIRDHLLQHRRPALTLD